MDYDVWHPSLEATRQVRVVDRGRSRDYQTPAIRLVTLDWHCPRCGEPRGEPYKHNFCEDGAWYMCDRWDNPCGHVDMYNDVLAESRQGYAEYQRTVAAGRMCRDCGTAYLGSEHDCPAAAATIADVERWLREARL